jgi:hypothetical protein
VSADDSYDPITINPYEVVEAAWPYDGPHDDETVSSAATAISRLVRYLNNATQHRNARHTLAWAATTDRITGSLHETTALLPQLLTQLAAAMRAQCDNPGLYDDRHDGRDAAVTASTAAGLLEYAADAAHDLAGQLASVRRHTTHLGNNEPKGGSR